jgi:hypothetical protein
LTHLLLPRVPPEAPDVEDVARSPTPSTLEFNLKNLSSWAERDFVNLDSLPW